MTALLLRAARLGWPQLLYRSPVMNERYIIPRGEAAWRAWAADALTCDVGPVAAMLAALETERAERVTG